METNWKKGDIAICVKVGHLDGNTEGQIPPLRLNSEYMVNDVRICECGSATLDVGLSLGKAKVGVQCSCGAQSSPLTGIWWCKAIRFVKKDTRTRQEQIEEAVAAENYELAEELKKLNIDQP